MLLRKYISTACIAYFILLLPSIALAEIAGKITNLEGRVDIMRIGAASAVPANIGDAVNVGDILRTKSNGKAEITFVDNSVMTLGPKSRLGIDEYLYKADEDKRTASLKLYRGRTGFNIPKPVSHGEGSKFEMKTRTAVAGVRGTEGILYTDGVERVYIKDGVVEFANPLGSVVVSKGEVGEIFYEKAPVERPFTEREYQQQERHVAPKPIEKAEPSKPVPAETKPPVPPPPDEFALLPPPPTELLLPPPGEFVLLLPPPLLPITDTTLNKTFSATGTIIEGEIAWRNSMQGSGTAAFIRSGGSADISGSFNQTILEGGSYHLDMKGLYDRVGISASQDPYYPSTDDWFFFFYSGSTSEGKTFYGGSVGDIFVNAAVDARWGGPNAGGTIGWIEDSAKKFWYIGGLSGSYTNIIFNNSMTPAFSSGTFSAVSDGLFWDGTRPFWEVFDKIIPTLTVKPDFFIPITETALRTFDVSGSGTLSLKDYPSTVGSMSTSISGKGIELAPGTGLFDVNVTGNWSLTSGTIQNLDDINGSISGSTSIGTTFNMTVEGGVKAINSSTAIVGADVKKTGDVDPAGIMIGKMTGTTSGTFDGKAIGEVKSGFMLP